MDQEHDVCQKLTHHELESAKSKIMFAPSMLVPLSLLLYVNTIYACVLLVFEEIIYEILLCLSTGCTYKLINDH